MHRWGIAFILLAFMAQSALVYGQTDPSYLKGEEWKDEAGAKFTTLYFTLGDKEWPNADPFRMVVIGDSIAWGCGLYTKEKYHYLVADWLQKTLKRPVEITVLAHTGATIIKPTNTDASKHAFIDPELGSWDPVLLEQAKHIPNPGDVDLILVSGGINDVGVDTLIVPIDNSYTINDRCQDVRDSMNILLRVLLNKCDKSVIIVTDYYAVVSKDTPSSSINKFADFVKENDPNWLHRTFSSKISDSADIISNNCAKFYSESIKSLSDSKGGAVYSANEYSRANFGKDRVYFAAVDFPSDRSYGTSKSLLWELLDTDNGGKTNDHKYYYRVSLCERVSCNWDDKIQAVAHPNVEGDQKYYFAIQKIIEQRLSDFGSNSNTNDQPRSFEPVEVEVKGPQPITLTLYVHDGSAEGPVLSDVEVTGQDAAGSSFQLVIDSNGYATIEGGPGTWSFSVSAFGYETSSWSQSIALTCTKHAFLQKTLVVTPTVFDVFHASIWTVSETGPTGNCPGTWTRRPGTDIFDASWSCEGGVTDVIDITSVEGNRIVLHRRGINGDYTGTISPDGTSISGTGSWFSPGTKWLVSIPKAVTITPTSFAVIHASIWTVQEIGPMGNCPGTWTRRPGTDTFDASWSCEGGVTDVIDITSVEGNKIVLHRRGINGDYTGTISPDGTSISGTGSWFSPGTKWLVSVPT